MKEQMKEQIKEQIKYFKLYVGYLLVKKLRIVLFNLKNHPHYRNS